MAVVPMHISQRLIAKSTLMVAVRDRIEQLEALKQDVPAMAKVSPPRIRSLMRGEVEKFSIDALIDLAEGLGLSTSLAVEPSVS